MATKTEFLVELFADNPDLKLADANRAWKQAGNEGEISESSYYKQKMALGKKGSRKTRKTTKAAASKTRKARSSQTSDNGHAAQKTAATTASDATLDLDELEAAIDDILFKLNQRDDTTEIMETLRSARRQITRLA